MWSADIMDAGGDRKVLVDKGLGKNSNMKI
jgi:hypothetical protein